MPQAPVSPAATRARATCGASGAIAMARIAVEEGEADDVRGLAQEIIRAQEAEILRMRIMLARHEDAPAVSERP